MKNISIGERLAEERRRSGLSQQAFAEIGGATKRSQINWEQGEQFPNADFLARLAAAKNIDVLYIVTGVRAVPIESGLTPRQTALLENYNQSQKDGQRAIERLAMLEAQQSKVNPAKPERKAA